MISDNCTNKSMFPEKYGHHLLFLFYPLRPEQEFQAGLAYEANLAEEGALNTVNFNRQKFDPYAHLVDEAYANFNADLIYNQDAYGQVENDETIEM